MLELQFCSDLVQRARAEWFQRQGPTIIEECLVYLDEITTLCEVKQHLVAGESSSHLALNPTRHSPGPDDVTREECLAFAPLIARMTARPENILGPVKQAVLARLEDTPSGTTGHKGWGKGRRAAKEKAAPTAPDPVPTSASSSSVSQVPRAQRQWVERQVESRKWVQDLVPPAGYMGVRNLPNPDPPGPGPAPWNGMKWENGMEVPDEPRHSKTPPFRPWCLHDQMDGLGEGKRREWFKGPTGIHLEAEMKGQSWTAPDGRVHRWIPKVDRVYPNDPNHGKGAAHVLKGLLRAH